jgi:hypothetical protein
LNDIIKRIHQVLGALLCIFELENIELSLYDHFGSFLNATAWEIHSTYHTTLQATPGQLVSWAQIKFVPLNKKIKFVPLNKKTLNYLCI